MRSPWIPALPLAATCALWACSTPLAPHIPPQASPSLSGPAFDTSGLYPPEEAAQQGAPRVLHVLHTNDMHGQVRPHRGQGGADALAGYVQKVRQEHGDEDVLLLDAGDIFMGTPEGTLTQGALMVDLMNLLRYDAMTLGNHEFDQGSEVLAQIGERAKFPLLAANVLPRGGAVSDRVAAHVQPLTIIERGGVKIAVIGLITPTTPNITHKDASAAFDFGEPLVAVRDALSTARAEGADFAIVLSHVGKEGEEALAAQLQPGDVPLILGGHSHTAIDPMFQSPSGVSYIQTGAKLSAISHVTIELGAEGPKVTGGRLVPLQAADWGPDPQVAEIMGRYSPDIEKLMSEVVGRCEVALPRDVDHGGSSPLGNLITDAMLAEAKADLALHNKTGIRSDLTVGDVQMRDLFEIAPFGNSVVKVKLTGAQVRQLLEGSLGRGRQNLEISGAWVVYDMSQPAGARIKSLKIGAKAAEDKKVYTLATNSYLAGGGDGMELLRDAAGKQDTGVLLRDALKAWLKGGKGCSYDRSLRIKAQ